MTSWWEHAPEDEAAMERSREMKGIARRIVRERGLRWPGDTLNELTRRASELNESERYALAWTCAARSTEWAIALDPTCGLAVEARALLHDLRARRSTARAAALLAQANAELSGSEARLAKASARLRRTNALVRFPELQVLVETGGSPDGVRRCARAALTSAWCAAARIHPLPFERGWVAQARTYAEHACDPPVQHEILLQLAQLEILETHPADPLPGVLGDAQLDALLAAVERASTRREV